MSYGKGNDDVYSSVMERIKRNDDDIDVFTQYIFDTVALFASQFTFNNSTYSY